MNVVLPKAGTYVVAVSGGVDSMALLHMLAHDARRTPNAERQFIVAHVDHGIRQDSSRDRALVEKTAQEYGLLFAYYEAQLGPRASESAARGARYTFLRQLQQERQAQAIITAHHQDDVLETAIINLLRGTGRKGLTSLISQPDIIRPLLTVPKAAVVSYAQSEGLQWHEDSTNQNTDYLRNYVRHRVLPRFDQAARARLMDIITDQGTVNRKLDALLVKQLQLTSVDGALDRRWFASLPHPLAREVLAGWLRHQNIRDFDRKTLERLVVAGKTAAPGRQFDVLQGRTMQIQKEYLALEDMER